MAFFCIFIASKVKKKFSPPSAAIVQVLLSKALNLKLLLPTIEGCSVLAGCQASMCVTGWMWSWPLWKRAKPFLCLEAILDSPVGEWTGRSGSSATVSLCFFGKTSGLIFCFWDVTWLWYDWGHYVIYKENTKILLIDLDMATFK